MLARSQCELDIRRCGVCAGKFSPGCGRLKERRRTRVHGGACVGRSSIDGNRKLGGCYDEGEEGWLAAASRYTCMRACAPASLCARVLESGKRIAAWRTRNRGRTMVDPFNYPRDSTRRRKQAPSRTGRCAALRTDRMTINSANISSSNELRRIGAVRRNSSCAKKQEEEEEEGRRKRDRENGE